MDPTRLSVDELRALWVPYQGRQWSFIHSMAPATIEDVTWQTGPFKDTYFETPARIFFGKLLTMFKWGEAGIAALLERNPEFSLELKAALKTLRQELANG